MSIRAHGSKQGKHLQIDIWISGDIAEVGFQDLLSASDVWVRDGDLAVKAPRPDQGLIKRLWEVGCRQHNHPLARLEPAGTGSALQGCLSTNQHV